MRTCLRFFLMARQGRRTAHSKECVGDCGHHPSVCRRCAKMLVRFAHRHSGTDGPSMPNPAIAVKTRTPVALILDNSCTWGTSKPEPTPKQREQRGIPRLQIDERLLNSSHRPSMSAYQVSECHPRIASCHNADCHNADVEASREWSDLQTFQRMCYGGSVQVFCDPPRHVCLCVDSKF